MCAMRVMTRDRTAKDGEESERSEEALLSSVEDGIADTSDEDHDRMEQMISKTEELSSV